MTQMLGGAHKPLHVADDVPYKSHELLKRWHEWQRRALLSDMENYVDGYFQFAFVYAAQGQAREAYARPNSARQRPPDVSATPRNSQGSAQACGEVRHLLAQDRDVNASIVCRRNQRPVFVRGIPVMEQIEQVVPTRFTVRLQSHNEVEEVGGNLMGQSILHRYLKPCSGFRERELNGLARALVCREGRNDDPVGVVKRPPESVKGVSSDNGSAIYDGVVLFSVSGALIGFCVCFEDVAEGLLFAQKCVEFVDVFRGPIDL